ncbi:MAG: hypothetical protein LQ343_007882 [Gyalolechia ehrenbergii]|nr:MAG: hypothetical protein LQ343_007882 [Gyalolechia ehrenbergii]
MWRYGAPGMGSADFYGQQRPMYRGQGGPLFGMAGGGGMPRLDDPYAIMHIGAPGDVVYRLTEAASQPGHPLYRECLQQGIPPGLIYDYIMEEKEMADQQGVPCRWDQVLERVTDNRDGDMVAEVPGQEVHEVSLGAGVHEIRVHEVEDEDDEIVIGLLKQKVVILEDRI